MTSTFDVEGTEVDLKLMCEMCGSEMKEIEPQNLKAFDDPAEVAYRASLSKAAQKRIEQTREAIENGNRVFACPGDHPSVPVTVTVEREIEDEPA